jgi:hypothetical protein
MNNNKANQNAILAQIGLNDVMIWKAPDFYVCNESLFDFYVSEEYRNSDRKETDEVYRISETVFIHKITGLRVGYVITENYEGDEAKYKLKDVFIITLQNKRMEVVDVDFINEQFVTTEGEIPFRLVKKSSKED